VVMSLFFGIYSVCNEVDSTVLLGSLYGRTLTGEFYKELSGKWSVSGKDVSEV